MAERPPPQMETPVAIFRFGPYESRPRTRELYKYGLKLKVRPQPLQVLNALLSHPGEVVTREELRQQIWSSETFVDFEHGLNTSVKEIRAALGDSAVEPRYIQTLPKIGYRFVAAVELTEPAVNMSPAQFHGSSAKVAGSPPLILDGFDGRAKNPARLSRWILPAIATILVAIAGIYFQSSKSRAHLLAPGEKMTLAILPFDNLTGDVAQDYFSDGLTEEMISQLGRVDPEHLGVIARTSVMRYKNTQKQLDQIGKELGVDYVLEGSVRRDSGNVRISAQLFRVKDQTLLWSRQYDRQLSNLLVLQSEIAQETADGIQLTFAENRKWTGRDSGPPPVLSPAGYEVYDLYLKGRYFWNKRSPEGFQQAIELFQEAIAKDPGYARAYAGLADSYALMSGYSLGPANESIPKARAAALKALQLDEKLAEAHVSLALIAQDYDWDWQTAMKEYERAIQLDPNYATAHHEYAEGLALQGRFEEAISQMKRARELDPLSLIMATDNGAILYYSRQYDRAIEQLNSVLEMEPAFPHAHIVVYAYVQKGQFDEALAVTQNWQRTADSPWIWASMAYVYGRAGKPAQARRAIEKLELLNRRHPIDPAPFVMAFTGIGDNDQAFAWLDRAIAARSPSLAALKVDPIYDPLRMDPRFQPLLHTVGLAQ